jgi:protease-4
MNDLFKNLFSSAFKILLCSVSMFAVFYFSFQEYKNWEMQKSFIPPFVDDGVCNVATVQISGTIGIGATSVGVDPATGQLTYSIPLTGDVDRVIHDLEYIKNSRIIGGVILQIDSYGGQGNAGQVLLSYLKNYPLPVVSLIRDAGDSMGYWVALGGKKIIAYPGADVGSIGVNSSYVSNVGKNKKEGLEYISIVSGKYKDLGVPDKNLTDEDLEYLKKFNQKYFNQFVEAVSVGRNMSIEDVKKIADGQSWLSHEAKDLGLIDEVGDQQTALETLQKIIQENSTVDIASGKENKFNAIPCPQY